MTIITAIDHPNITIRKKYKNTIINKQNLILEKQSVATQPAQELLNILMSLKITKRSWKKENERRKQHRKTDKRKRNKKQLTTHLPTIINTNCRSVCNKKIELEQLLSDTNIDIAILSETWITEENEATHLNDIRSSNKNYIIHSQKRSRDDAKRGGGVMILVNKNYSSTTAIENHNKYIYNNNFNRNSSNKRLSYPKT